MKMLVLSHVSEYLGGAERSILEVIDVWRQEYDIEVEFIIRRPVGSYAKELAKRGFKYYDLDYTYWSDSNPPNTKERKYSHSLRNSRAIVAIEDIISKSKPDVVLTNSIVAPWAALAAHFSKVPHIWFAREYGDLDHGREFEIERDKTFEDIGNLSTIVLSNSKTLESYLSNFIDSNKLLTVYTPMDIESLNTESDKKIENPFQHNKSVKLVFTGNITASKGQKNAVEAVGILAEKNHNLELCLIGKVADSNYMKEINAVIDKYSLKDRVHFVGYQSNPLPYIKAADIGVIASRKEAFGRVTFEYLALGKPVVGSDSGATPELVEDGVTGYLYKPNDVASLSRNIEKYLKNRASISTHGNNAKNKANALMSSDNSASKTIHTIKGKLENRPNLLPVINYTHTWLSYPETAKKYYMSESFHSSKTKIKHQTKEAIRPYYNYVRSAKSKLRDKL